jgi:hypothetical protein
VSQQPTPQDRVAYAIGGLMFVRDYLTRRGILHILFVPMVTPTQSFAASTDGDLLEEVAAFNREVTSVGLARTLDYGLGRPGIVGSDPDYYERGYYESNDGLHPGPLGHASIARAMLGLLRDVAVRL